MINKIYFLCQLDSKETDVLKANIIIKEVMIFHYLATSNY